LLGWVSGHLLGEPIGHLESLQENSLDL
jgi:hypothetical protein